MTVGAMAMPARFNIRLDLLLVLPAYAVVLLSSIVRWLADSGTQRITPPFVYGVRETAAISYVVQLHFSFGPTFR